ncbi:MAG: NAD(P)H-hydrate dehydratase [Bacteroidetes bacterium]|nr:MAG: NAD(P)H-hydrate dehydratase [Bacteroidota bacterium]
MMKIFTTKQIAELDKYTIENEPVSDIDLMERASLQITGWLVNRFSTENKMIFFAGPGNNGGDAMAIARQMADLDFQCEVYLLNLGRTLKGSPAINWQRLEEQGKIRLSKVSSIHDFPEIGQNDVVIDGLFGSGLTRPLEGLPAEVVRKINAIDYSGHPTLSRVTTTRVTNKNAVVSIDIPSGLMGENNTGNIPENIIRADFTLTFQFPKISFFFAENEKYVGDWEVLPIRLHPDGITQVPSDFILTEKEDVQQIIQKRSRFGHKGTYGHALLIAGSYGKMGAAVLASKACLRAGAGLLTTHVPHLGYPIIQTAVPEAMASVDQHDSYITEFPGLAQFSAVGVGPGIDRKTNTKKALGELLEKVKSPLVIDADALNILAEDQLLLDKLPQNCILTPHPGEFKRLAGDTENSWLRIQRQIEFSKKYKVIVVLKGAFTTISTQSGMLFFNTTGNPGMATAGSGDVLTGIILGLLAQDYSPENAAIAGVYLHGLAGDLAVLQKSDFSMIAGDIIEFLGRAFLHLKPGSE